MDTLVNASWWNLAEIGFVVGGFWKIGGEIFGRIWDVIYAVVENAVVKFKPKGD